MNAPSANIEVLGRDARVAAQAVCDAVRFMRRIHDETILPALTKRDASLVTLADFVVQALLASRLAHDFPGDPLVAEEDATALRATTARELRGRVIELAGRALPGYEPEEVLASIDRGGGSCDRRFWTLDPIDGTRGLLRGGQYAIALALVVEGLVQVGIIGCPRLSLSTGPSGESVVVPVEDDVEGGVAIAVRGRGAWWMSPAATTLTRLTVSAEADATRARALHSYESRHSDVGVLQHVLRELGSQRPPMLMDGQVKHVLLAASAAELLLRVPTAPGYHEAIWDQAPGSLLIEEAGGRVTDVEGWPLDFTTGRRLLRNTGLLASNGLFHEAVLHLVRPRVAP